MNRAGTSERAANTEQPELLIPRQADIDRNVKDGTFFRVFGKKSAKNNLSIGGALNNFKKDPTFIYVDDGFNLAGPREYVRQVLMSFPNLSQAEIDEVLANAITKENIKTTGKARYEALFNIYAEKQSNVKQLHNEGYSATGVPSVTLDMLAYIYNSIKKEPQRVEKARAPRLAASVAGPATSSRPPAKTLAERINLLPAGKVLDVTSMRPNGSGVLTIKTPGPTSAKVGVNLNDLPIVSSDAEGYRNAINALSAERGEDFSAYIPAWEALHAQKAPRARRTAAAPASGTRTVTKKATSARPTPVRAPPPLTLPAVAPVISAAPLPTPLASLPRVGVPSPVSSPPRSPLRLPSLAPQPTTEVIAPSGPRGQLSPRSQPLAGPPLGARISMGVRRPTAGATVTQY